jgi:hypothetical protein
VGGAPRKRRVGQAQILTTHNRAVLVGLADALGSEWIDFATRCLGTVSQLVARLPHNPHPLRAVKKAAYGWRRMIFFLSLASAPD